MVDVPRDHRTVPAIVDYRAQHSPEQLFCFLPRDESLQDGFAPFTFAALKKAVDKTAWWLDDVLGGAAVGGDTPILPYIGQNDIRYAILFIAAIKTKRALMVPFPANTPEGLARLVKSSNATVLLASSSHLPIWTPVLKDAEDMRAVEVPEVSYFINDQSVKQYSYVRTLDQAMDDTVCILQTSGTTGNPQPIHFTHRNINDNHVQMAVISRDSPPNQKLAFCELQKGSCIPALLPFSWSAGLFFAVVWPLLYDFVPILLPSASTKAVTGDLLAEISKAIPNNLKGGLVLIPDTLRTLVQSPEHLKALSRWAWIAYAGAPLDHVTGDLVAKSGPRIQSFMGGTDSGIYPFLLNEPEDWKIHRFHPDVGGHYLEPFTDELYELCIKRQPQDSRHCFTQNPESTVYHTKDLWQPVEGREGFYRTAGRVDDFVKLATMTKFNAVSFEQILDGHASIAKSLVAGDARERTFAIVQPAIADDDPPEVLLDLIWPAVEETNRTILTEARLTRELTIITSPNKPIIQTAKGTIDRRNTIKMYEKEIDEAYEKAGLNSKLSSAKGGVWVAL